MVKRRASAPYWSMSPSGSKTLPLDLLIFWPFSSRTRPWMAIFLNGTSPSMKCIPIIIMRATQKKMMSRPVTRTEVG
jgi:hypothetical protein